MEQKDYKINDESKEKNALNKNNLRKILRNPKKLKKKQKLTRMRIRIVN